MHNSGETDDPEKPEKSENPDALNRHNLEDVTWIEVAQTGTALEAEVIAGLLRSADIPTHVESLFNLPGVFFGQGGPGRVFVPSEYYDDALDLLEGDDDAPSELDEPGIKF